MAHLIIIQNSSFRNYLANFRNVIRPRFPTPPEQ